MLKFKTSCAVLSYPVLSYLLSNLLNEVGLSLFRYFEVGLRVCDIVVKKFTFAISSPDEFLYLQITRLIYKWNKPYLLLFSSRRASLHFDQCSFSISLAVERLAGSSDRCSAVGLIVYCCLLQYLSPAVLAYLCIVWIVIYVISFAIGLGMIHFRSA